MQEPLPVPGDVIWIRQQRWRVEHARRDGPIIRLDVVDRGHRLTFLAPFDRPITVARRERPRHVRPQQARARLAGLVHHTRGWRTLTTAADANVTVLPHQLEPALAVLTGARRILIADEVGLGKTIQAGLIVAELVERQRGTRVLIVVPAALRHQWIDELSTRFKISCAAADAGALDTLGRAGDTRDSPWRRSSIWIASLDYLKQPHVLDAMPAQPWDLIVADEAHGACGESARSDALNVLAQRGRRVVLLTATPHGGDAARFTRLTAIGALPGVDDPLTIFRRTRRELGARLDRRVRWHGVRLSPAETQLFDVLIAFEQTVLRAAGAARMDAALLLLSVFRKRALSTMTALVTSLDRRLQWLGEHTDMDDIEWLQTRLNFDPERDSDSVGEEERDSLRADVGLQEGHERSWLRRLRLLAETARARESKIARLVSLVRRAGEPVAIFTEFRHSLDAIRRPLERVRPVATLHGGQSPIEQRRELERFLDGATSILVATDVASQGLNLQTRARWVVNLELPWNPTRLEQRAGRVDRIGQTRPVHVTLLVARHDAEAGVLARLARRTLSARQAFGDEMFHATAPSDAQLRACLIGRVPLDAVAGPPPAPVTLCRTWTRHAQVAARHLRRRRALASQWRTGGVEPAGAGWTTTRGWPRLAVLAPNGLCAFSVPIVDTSGHVIEKHVIAVHPPSSAAWWPANRDLIEQARRVAGTALAPRVARLRRMLIAQLDIARARERAIGEMLVARRCPEEVQTGLFDQRELRRADGARRDVDDLRESCDRAVAALEDATEIVVGRPTLALVLAPRR